MSQPGQRLFNLLPALYRMKDAQLSPGGNAPGPLQSLLMVIEEQLAVLADDLDQLYDDQFIETCAPWVIPYIGDLIGYQPVHGVATALASPRAEVAHTISFRRRKGTILVLEQLARDVTGWGAHAMEVFKVLATTQYTKSVRPLNHYSPDLRRWQIREYVDTSFDGIAHKIDVRQIGTGGGRYNIQNIGIFLWSLNAYSLTKVTATPVDSSGQFYRFNPLGVDMPLFNNPVSQGSNIAAAALPVNVPDRLRRTVLCNDIQSGAGAVYYGAGNSLALYLNNTLLNPYQIQVCNLSGGDGSWANVPAAGSQYAACIDPELGRIALPPLAAGSAKPSLQASFYFGFNGDMGGGEYPRTDSFTIQPQTPAFPFPDTANPSRYATLQDALNFATKNAGANLQAAVEIAGSDVYEPSKIYAAGSTTLQANVPAGMTLELRAADGSRPALILNSEFTVEGAANSIFALNGLLITYVPSSVGAAAPVALVHVPAAATNLLSQLQLTHCTLVPGQTGLVTEVSGLQLLVQKSILGPMRVQQLATAKLADSIVDAGGATAVAYANLDGSSSGGGSLTLEGCTVIGKIHATLFALISDSIVLAQLAAADTWTASLWADRRQQGCIRFSYVPASAVLPRQFECIQQSPTVPPPIFYSLRYGDPGYAKLLPSTSDAIWRGADDGGEMGAFHFVLASLRETDLRVRLQEYLPVGLEFGILYQN
jgi:hypothetical protein